MKSFGQKSWMLMYGWPKERYWEDENLKVTATGRKRTEQREQKPSWLGLCRVASDEGEANDSGVSWIVRSNTLCHEWKGYSLLVYRARRRQHNNFIIKTSNHQNNGRKRKSIGNNERGWSAAQCR